MSGVVPVVKADREAARPLWAVWWRNMKADKIAEFADKGLLDDHELVQAFARHRLAETARLEAEIERLRGALEFYADPGIYHAISIIGDRPCGEFYDDFSQDHGDPDYKREMPGKTARTALAADTGEG